MNFFDTFISYGRADSKFFATKLQERLTAEGLKVWFDQNDIPLAVDFQEQINDGIERAYNFLFIIAPHSVNSPYCRKEIDLAIKLNKRIIPLLHVEQISQEIWQQRNPHKTLDDWQEYQTKGLHSSFNNMPSEIGKINWVYFRENLDDFETSFEGLLRVIHKDQNYVEKHTQILAQSLDWMRNQKQTNYLLIGEERQQAETWLKRKFGKEQPPCIPTDLHCEFIEESIKNANNLLTQVFLAASEKDDKIKDKIAKSLRRESFTIWTNQTDIKTGIDFQSEINKGIEGADNFVYFISPDGLQSDYCQQELDHALDNHKRILPLLIEKIDLGLIPSSVRKLQLIDFTDSEDEEKYRQSLAKLLAELKEDASYYQTHKSLLVKARKWERQNQNPSLLLRGYNLQHFEAWLKVAKRREDHPPLPLQEEFITASLNKTDESSLEVFISYSRTDSDLARKLNEALQELGKTTWFDQESIATGADFKQEIYRGIESSDNFLFIISPKSVNSSYCADEVEYAQKLNKRIVTILYRPLSAEDREKLPPALARVQWLDFNQHGGEFFANFNELVRTLETDRDYVRSHSKWSQRALEWQENGGEDLLLRGSELAIAENWLKEARNKQPPATELQKAFIGQSIALREKIKQREIIRRQREIRTSWGIAIGSLIAVIISSSLGLVAWHEKQQAEFNQAKALSFSSLYLDQQGKNLEALVQAIYAGKTLKQQHQKDSKVLEALQNIYQIREQNLLQGHTDSIYSISISPNGKILASASFDKTIKLWHLETGQEIRTLKGHSAIVSSVSFSPDGKTLASGSFDKRIKLWNPETGQEIRTLTGHHDIVSSVSFSPDGKTLASGSFDETIKLWNPQTGQEIRTLKGHSATVSDISFTPDGQILASSSFDDTIKLWNPQTGQELRTLRGHKGKVYRISISPDGKMLASGGFDNTIKLWNLQTGREIRTLTGHENIVASVSFSPFPASALNKEGLEGILASGSFDKTIKLWDLKTGQEIDTLKGHKSAVSAVSFTPDGQILVSGSGDNNIKLWNLKPRKELRTFWYDNNVETVSVSPDGKILASGSSDNNIKLWNLENNQPIYTLKGHDANVSSLSFSPIPLSKGGVGRILASGSRDNTIKLWNVQTGKVIRTLTGHNEAVYSVAFSPLPLSSENQEGVEEILASGSEDNTIKLWNVKTGKIIRTIWTNDPVYTLGFSPDGKILASSGYDNKIKLWNLKTGQAIRTLIGHNAAINSISFSPDGELLASGSNDKTIKLWDIKAGKVIKTLWHNDLVLSVSFSPDGKTLASGSVDDNIKLWNLDTRQETSLNGHQNAVNSLVFSPDGKTLISGSSDNTVKLWSLEAGWDLDSLLRVSCHWIRNYLTYNPNVSESDRHLCDGIGSQHK